MSRAAAVRDIPANDSFIHSARRAQLVDSAVAVIAEHGAERASMVKIARHAGVSRGVISYHFRDLDDLHGAVVSEVYRLGGERLREPVATAATARHALLLFVEGSLTFYAEFPDQLAALHEIFTVAGRSRAVTRQHLAELDDVASLLRDGQRAGLFRDFDVTLMTRSIRAVLDTGRGALRQGDDLARVRTELVASIDAMTREER